MCLDNMAWSGTNWLSWSKGLIVWYRLIMKCYARNYQNEINKKTNTLVYHLVVVWDRDDLASSEFEHGLYSDLDQDQVHV